MKPRKVRRRYGLPVPEGAVFTGTGSKWMTPFVVGVPRVIRDADGKAVKVVPGSEDEAFALYRWYLGVSGLEAEAAEELRGRDLCCWCLPETPCHTDVLLELANPVSAAEAA